MLNVKYKRFRPTCYFLTTTYIKCEMKILNGSPKVFRNIFTFKILYSLFYISPCLY